MKLCFFFVALHPSVWIEKKGKVRKKKRKFIIPFTSLRLSFLSLGFFFVSFYYTYPRDKPHRKTPLGKDVGGNKSPPEMQLLLSPDENEFQPISSIMWKISRSVLLFSFFFLFFFLFLISWFYCFLPVLQFFFF